MTIFETNLEMGFFLVGFYSSSSSSVVSSAWNRTDNYDHFIEGIHRCRKDVIEPQLRERESQSESNWFYVHPKVHLKLRQGFILIYYVYLSMTTVFYWSEWIVWTAVETFIYAVCVCGRLNNEGYTHTHICTDIDLYLLIKICIIWNTTSCACVSVWVFTCNTKAEYTTAKNQLEFTKFKSIISFYTNSYTKTPHVTFDIYYWI